MVKHISMARRDRRRRELPLDPRVDPPVPEVESMATGETIDPRDRELEAPRRENAELRRQVEDLKSQLADALRKLEEARRAQKRQAASSK